MEKVQKYKRLIKELQETYDADIKKMREEFKGSLSFQSRDNSFNRDVEEITAQICEEIFEEMRIFSKKREEFDSSWDWDKSFHEYKEAVGPISRIQSSLDRQYRLIRPVKLGDPVNRKEDDVMSLEDFIESCKDGGFIDSDGHGRYVRDGRESNIHIYPSDVTNGVIREGFDEVIWFNK
jgi:hypothetical protein